MGSVAWHRDPVSESEQRFIRETTLNKIEELVHQTLRSPSTSPLTSNPALARVLEFVYKLVVTGKTATKRSVFYADVPLFVRQERSDRAIERACCILSMPRCRLRIFGSPRGFVSGSVSISTFDGAVSDCSQSPWSIRGDVGEALCGIESSGVRCIVVVEKHSVFQQLSGSAVSCGGVFVTGRGFPDVATCDMVRFLDAALCVPVFAVVDWDPFGVAIVDSFVLSSLPAGSFQRLSQVDLSEAQSLLSRNPPLPEAWQCELRSMVATGRKVEIEGLEALAPVCTVVRAAISRALDDVDGNFAMHH